MKIDKGIPVPQARKFGKHRPFDQMEVGDSIFADGAREGRLLYNSAKGYAFRHKVEGWKCVGRVENGGWRVWRTA